MSTSVMRRDRPKKKRETADQVWGALSQDNSRSGSVCSSEISEFKVDMEKERSMDHPDHLSDLLAQLAEKEARGVNVLNSREDLMDPSLYDDTLLENTENVVIEDIPLIDEAQAKDLQIRVARFKSANKAQNDSPPISPPGATPKIFDALAEDNLLIKLRTLQKDVQTEDLPVEPVDAEDFLKAFEELDKK